MNQITPQFKAYGDSAILVDWPSIIDKFILTEVISFRKKLENYKVKEILYVNNAYNSILIGYVSTIDKINDEILDLKELFFTKSDGEFQQYCRWQIPVCYDQKYSLDLYEISNQKEMEILEIIRLHSEAIYTVYFIGFLPGFLYLGGLDTSLHFDRKSQPRLKVEKGAVGIGGSQTGIYPTESPGGWNIIGNSPIDFFDPNKNEPCFAKPGDEIQFMPIDLKNHDQIREQISNGTFDYDSLKVKINSDD